MVDGPLQGAPQNFPTILNLVSVAGKGLQPQSNRSAATDPTAADDNAAGYRPGSYWVNLATDTYWVCVDDTNGAAVWLELAPTDLVSAAGPGLQPQSNRSAAIDPTVADDNAAGYRPGSYWVNLAADTYWVCVDDTNGAAVWLEQAPTALVSAAGPGLQPQSNRSAAVNPTVASDNAAGYRPGSYWVNLATNTYWVCVDDTNGAAVWLELAPTDLVSAAGPGLQPQSNRSAAIPPSAADDNQAGYRLGSYWVTPAGYWVCLDDTDGAAVWLQLGAAAGRSKGGFQTAAPGTPVADTIPLTPAVDTVPVPTDPAPDLVDFTHTGGAVNELEYTGAVTKTFFVEAKVCLNALMGFGGEQVGILLEVGGTPLSSVEWMFEYLPNAQEIIQVSINRQVTLSMGETIRILMTTSTGVTPQDVGYYRQNLTIWEA